MQAAQDVIAPDTIAQQIRQALADILPGAAAQPDGRALRQRGLDSLAATRLTFELRDRFGVDVPIARLGRCTGAEDLAELVTEFADAAVGAPAAGPVGDPDDRYEPFPLTALQQAYLTGRHEDLTADPVGCHLYREFVVEDLDVDRLRAAWQRVVDRHDMLRSVLTDDGRQAVQRETPRWTMPVHAADRAGEVRDRLTRRRYEPGQWPPFDVEVTHDGAGAGVVHFGVDALVTDGPGLDLMLEHWGQAYRAPGEPLPEAAMPARAAVTAAIAGGAARDADREYWRRRLADLPDAPRVLTDHPAPPVAGGWPRRALRASLAPAAWSELRARAGRLGVSPTAFVLAVFSHTLTRHGAGADHTLVLTTNLRSRLPAEAASVVAPLTSTSVLPIEDVPARTVEESAVHLHEQLWEDLDHASVSGVEALRGVRTRSGAPAALPVVFTSLLDEAREFGAGEFAAAVRHGASRTSAVALDAQLWQRDGRLHLHWDVTDAVLPAGLADVLFAAFVNALGAAAVQDPARAEHRPLNDLQQAYVVASLGNTAGAQEWDGCQVFHAFEAPQVDAGRLGAAWARMLAAYDPLRSTVTADGELLVWPQAPAEWHVPVLSGAATGTPLAEHLVSSAFPLGQWPRFDLRVLRGDTGPDTIALTIDLIVCDGRSVHQLMRELLRLYADPAAEPRATEPIERREAGSEQARAYWRERLAGLPSGPALPMPGAPGGSPRRVRHEAVVPDWTRLRGRAAEDGIGPDALLLAALTEALGGTFTEPFAVSAVRWTEATRPCRPGEYTALSWVAHDPAEPVWDRARRIQAELTADEGADAASGLAQLRRLILKRPAGSMAYKVVHTGLLDLAGEPVPAGMTAANWLTCTPDVSLDCIPMDCGDGTLRCTWDATEADFADGVPAALLARYVEILSALAAPVRETPSWHRMVYGWNDTARPFTADGPVHLAFQEQARQRPDAVALRWRTGTMTYAELNRRANAVAWDLRDRGVGDGSVVGIRACRGPGMVVAVFGILKAGGAYLPVEPYLPAERAADMLGTAGAVALLSSPGVSGWEAPAGLPVIELPVDAPAAGDPPAGRDPEPVNGPDSTAYIIYTSGSTGRPKGVAVTHRPLHNLFAWCRRMFGFGPGDLGLCVTSLGFDLSVFDVLGLLGYGAALYIADERQQKDPGLLLDVLRTEGVTFWNSAPTTLHQLAPLFPAAGEPGTDKLRLVYLSGDYTPLPLPAALRAAFPGAELVSLGGATEATVWSNYFPVGDVDPGWRSIPYGWPIDNCRYHILDEELRPCPPGREGDLYIAGACLSQGYVNRPDLTAERFVRDPFSEAPDERMYRTGDRATYFPDGTISFLGRLDNQVKIRGFRVELGEIEHRLRAHPGVADVVVLARPDHAGDRKVVAYVIAGPDCPPTARDLRRHAAGTLPDYMVPNHVVFVDSFPATGNGKLDRDALPWPPPAEAVPPAEPTSPAEAAPSPTPEPADAAGAEAAPSFAALHAEVGELLTGLLGLDELDPAADLWDLGATSFTMVQLSAALQRRHRRRVPVATLLSDPTADGIAAAVAGTLGIAATAVPAATPPAAPGTVPEVDFFDPEQRADFKRAGWNVRPPAADRVVVPLHAEALPVRHYRWRGSRRDFTDLTGAPLPVARLDRLLRLLRPVRDGDRDRRLYPSAGDTYAVQVYVHVRPGGVAGLDPGVYYYRAAEHALELVTDRPALDRSTHFFYNREVFDRAAFQLFLIGQDRGIEPLYGEDGGLYLALEAGYLGQLLLSGQAEAQVGLCPVGAVAFDRVREDLGLDDGHRFLHAFLGGPVPPPEPATADAVPPFAAPGAPAQAAPAPAVPDRAADDVAIVGVAGRYPGADDLDALWRLLTARRTAIGPMPPARAAALGLDDRLSTVDGGFLPDLETFNSMVFRIAPAEAATLDPQLRLLLETVWRCVEDAGYTPDSVRDLGRVGVFVASMWPDHHQTGADAWRAGGAAERSGIAADLPNRISHVFGWHGPSVAVDTSCSSALTALHLAVRSLRQGECSAAVVAGVNLVSHPYHLALLSGLDLVTAGGQGAFDADASGWRPGEGVGAVLLRPAGAAARDRDTTHAVIEGTWIGNAGHTVRFGAPDAGSLAASLRETFAAAGIGAGDIGYVECAAAGAAIADAAEIAALDEVFRGRPQPVPAGTVKPNLGHLEAASGMSQLAKALLQLRHRQLAPTLLAPRRNPLVDWDPAVLRMVETAEPWPGDTTGAPSRILLNALGATGSYAHAVIRAGEAR